MLPRIRVMYATFLLTALVLMAAHARQAQVVRTGTVATAVAATPAR